MASQTLLQDESIVKASKTTQLYSFESATIKLTAAAIVPAIFKVTVKGTTGSLNPTINLVNTGKIEKQFLVFEVQGNDGMAIGSMPYKRSANVRQILNTEGIIVKGAGNKSVTLKWKEAPLAEMVGLFNLPLATTGLFGAPTLHLNLAVDTVNNTVSGIATVTAALEHPNLCTSHVTGNLIYESVMKPGVSKIRIDLTGYPEISWPSGGGIGPVIPKNFSAIILFDTGWTNGVVQYQFATYPGGWVKEEQAIAVIR